MLIFFWFKHFEYLICNFWANVLGTKSSRSPPPPKSMTNVTPLFPSVPDVSTSSAVGDVSKIYLREVGRGKKHLKRQFFFCNKIIFLFCSKVCIIIDE